jgi:hypothetical protein
MYLQAVDIGPFVHRRDFRRIFFHSCAFTKPFTRTEEPYASV